MLKKLFVSILVFPLVMLVSAAQASPGFPFSNFPLPNIVLSYTGYAQPNTFDGQLPPAFHTYCANNSCSPTTQFPLIDPTTGLTVGRGYAWAKGYTEDSAGTTLCFTEFIKYDLAQGTIYTQGNPNGTCAALEDPSFVPPPVTIPAVVELSGGGRGKIVAGTGAFTNWVGGTYLDRVVVDENGDTGVITYYDGLYFTLTPPTTPDGFR